MIPKVINYCWFGRGEKSDVIKFCIDSWKKFCPDFQIVEWNEDNFDFSICKYAKEAYEEKKWAFVADYARIKIMLDYGGIYMDTDVELIKNIDALLKNDAFMGFEEGLGINSGLIMGSIPNHEFIKIQEELYRVYSFKTNKGYNTKTCVEYTTELLMSFGLIKENKIQTVKGVTIYPIDFFCPLNMKTGELKITENTYSIHKYEGSWASDEIRYGYHLKWIAYKKYGHFFGKIMYAVKYSFFIIKKKGIKRFFRKIKDKISK